VFKSILRCAQNDRGNDGFLTALRMTEEMMGS
jgi:hypothetical protein